MPSNPQLITPAYNLVYNPTLKKGSTYHTMPTPLHQCDEAYNNRIEVADIPLVDGTLVTSGQRGALTVQFSGTIVKSSRSAVLDEKDTLYSLMGPESVIDFYRYYDVTNGYYRWFPNAYVQDLVFHHTPFTVFHLPYSFTLLVPGGQESVSGTFPTVGATAGTDPMPSDKTTLYGPLVLDLADAVGASAVYVRNSTGDIVAKIDSAGNLYVTGLIIEATSITED